MAAPLVLILGREAPLSASVNPTGLSGFVIGSGTAVTGLTAICTAAGGAPGYTYLWTFVSGDSDIGPINGTSASTKFNAYFSGPGILQAVYKCVVTDAAANVVDSNTVTISMECFS